MVVDDEAMNQRLLSDLLRALGHAVTLASGGQQALAVALADPPDLLLLDVLMPDLDGFEVCRRLRAAPQTQLLPIVMITTLDTRDDRVRGIEAGADDFLSKPFQRAELQARVSSLLRVKALYDEVARQRQTLADWSATLERRVQEKVQEVERLSQLKRFFSPSLAERLLADGFETLLSSRRREISVLFIDLRGFTAFAERSDAARVMALLREFHAAVGEQVFRHGGTIERFTGDGMMVFFNDPDPVPDHALRAVQLAVALRDSALVLAAGWAADGGPEGVGFGLSKGIATIGAIGFSARLDYAAIGTVTNLAARLCAQAPAGEILVCDALWADVAPHVQGQAVPALALKGWAAAVPAWRVDALRPPPTSAPAAPSAA
jgi:class 3 adenylate cyclase